MRSLLIIIFIFYTPLTRAQEAVLPQKVSYAQYLSQVLAYYPTLKKEHASLEKVIAQKALAASGRMPQFWASVKSEYGNDSVYVFGALLRQNRFTSEDFALDHLNKPSSYSDNSAGMEGQWLLFDFGQTASRIKAVGTLADSARFQEQLTRMEAILAASEVYSRLVVAQQLLGIIRETSMSANEDINAALSLQHQGMVLGADFYAARMRQTQLEQLSNEIQAQHAALSLVFNVLRGTDPALPVQVFLDFKRPLEFSGDIKEWIAKTITGRLDIKVLNRILEAQTVQEHIEKKSFLPRIVAYGNTDEHAHSLNSDARDHYMAGVKAQMDIFDPGFGARVKMAKEEVNRLLAQLQELKDQAVKDTSESFYRFQALNANYVLAANMYDDAQKTVELTQPLYREGRSNITSMVETRMAMVDAYERWLKMESARRQSLLTLQFYAGALNQEHAQGIYGQ